MVSSRKSLTFAVVFAVVFFVFVSTVSAQVTYQKPPKEILDVLNAPLTPQMIASPTRTHVLFIAAERYPSIA